MPKTKSVTAAAAGKARDLIQSLATKGSPIPRRASMSLLSRKLWWWLHINDDEASAKKRKKTKGQIALIKHYGLDESEAETIPLVMLRCQRYPAFVYEVAVRFFASGRIPIPWIRLPSEAKASIIDAFEPPQDWTGSAMYLGDDSPEKGWTNPCKLSFPLHDSDERLMKTFLELVIKPERERLRIPNPGRRANANRKNRGFSWRPIEALDERQILGRTLSAPDRGALSKAKKEVLALLGIDEAIR